MHRRSPLGGCHNRLACKSCARGSRSRFGRFCPPSAWRYRIAGRGGCGRWNAPGRREAQSRRQDLAITVAQGQRPQGIRGAHDPAPLVCSIGLGNECYVSEVRWRAAPYEVVSTRSEQLGTDSLCTTIHAVWKESGLMTGMQPGKGRSLAQVPGKRSRSTPERFPASSGMREHNGQLGTPLLLGIPL